MNQIHSAKKEQFGSRQVRCNRVHPIASQMFKDRWTPLEGYKALLVNIIPVLTKFWAVNFPVFLIGGSSEGDMIWCTCGRSQGGFLETCH